MMREAGVKPEIEVFDPGMIYNAGYYLKKISSQNRCISNFAWALREGSPQPRKNLVFMKDTMEAVAPEAWSAFGVGAGAMEIMYAAIALGGNIRVGMEDNVLYKRASLLRATCSLSRVRYASCGNITASRPRRMKRAGYLACLPRTGLF